MIFVLFIWQSCSCVYEATMLQKSKLRNNSELSKYLTFFFPFFWLGACKGVCWYRQRHAVGPSRGAAGGNAPLIAWFIAPALPVVQYMYSICTVFGRFRSVQILYKYCTYTVQRAEKVPVFVRESAVFWVNWWKSESVFGESGKTEGRFWWIRTAVLGEKC